MLNTIALWTSDVEVDSVVVSESLRNVVCIKSRAPLGGAVIQSMGLGTWIGLRKLCSLTMSSWAGYGWLQTVT